MQLCPIVLGLFTSFCTANFYFNMFTKCFSTNDICVICHYNFIYLLNFCCLSFLLLWTPLYYVRCVIIIVLFLCSVYRWNYQTQDELDGSSHWGQLSSYGGGGYIEDLATTKAESLEIIAKLKNNLWLDRGTRAVFTDFTVYNANINLFCVIR